MHRAANRARSYRFAATIAVEASASVNAAQQAAFQAGSGVDANALLLGIASVVMLLSFVWAMWVTFGTFRAWQDGSTSLLDLAWSALRASIILMVLGFYLR